jgi:molecular chaperone DnaK
VLSVARRDGEPAQVTVALPASWRDHRARLLREVAARAGAPPSRLTLVPAPVAACLHHVDRHRPDPGTLLGVYDLGGGTFEAGVLRVTPAGAELLGTALCSSHLAGAVVDRELMRHVTTAIGDPWRRLDHGEAAVRTGVHRLRWAVVAAKEVLTVTSTAVVPVALLGIETEVTVTRAQLEVAVEPLLLGTLDLFDQCPQGAGVEAGDLDCVLLIGGGSRMPLAGSVLGERLGVPLATAADPQQAVSLGAAVAAGRHLTHPWELR